jgi:rhamnopyranosyl-N-acetylglucosaminyl-diphospho-decaprenol beta-1,3/1,4-galactofuranosyltransferase
VVINNASVDITDNILEKWRNEIIVINMQTNVGGAGGFYRGMKFCYDRNIDWIWMMDDDGVPAPDALYYMLAALNKNPFDIANSLVVDKNNTDRISFGLEFNGKILFGRKEITDIADSHGIIEGQINPFNGTLISRKTISDIGFIRREMFIWGDEKEYIIRAISAKKRVVTVTESIHLHPNSKTKEVRIPGLGRLGRLIIAPPHAARIHARNMAFLTRKKGIILVILRALVYIVYFILHGQFARAYWFFRYWLDGTRDNYTLPPSRAELNKAVELFQVVEIDK